MALLTAQTRPMKFSTAAVQTNLTVANKNKTISTFHNADAVNIKSPLRVEF